MKKLPETLHKHTSILSPLRTLKNFPCCQGIQGHSSALFPSLYRARLQLSISKRTPGSCPQEPPLRLTKALSSWVTRRLSCQSPADLHGAVSVLLSSPPPMNITVFLSQFSQKCLWTVSLEKESKPCTLGHQFCIKAPFPELRLLVPCSSTLLQQHCWCAVLTLPGYGHVLHKPQLRGCICIPSPGSSTGGTTAPWAPGQGSAVPQTCLVSPQRFWRTWPNTRAPVWTPCFSHSQESSSLASTSFTHRGTQKSNN